MALTEENPHDRISLENALNHKWIKSIISGIVLVELESNPIIKIHRKFKGKIKQIVKSTKHKPSEILIIKTAIFENESQNSKIIIKLNSDIYVSKSLTNFDSDLDETKIKHKIIK